MTTRRAARLQVGSAPWITEERASASQIAQSEIEEFSFSARNDFDWLNEHMAEIFSENQINVAEIFKTPGKLRGKTPRTVRKANAGENRVPLSDIFSATPKGAPNPFSIPNLGRHNTPRVKIAADPQPSQAQAIVPTSPSKPLASPHVIAHKQPVSMVDSGYHGSQSQDAMDIDDPTVLAEPPQTTVEQQGVRCDHVALHLSPNQHGPGSPRPQVPDATIDTITGDQSTQFFTAHVTAGTSPARKAGHHESTTPAGSPTHSSQPALFASTTPMKSPLASQDSSPARPRTAIPDGMETVLEEPSRSGSDGSSPIRPIVRKSSLNFASLPAREPITHKSVGNRISRSSHLEQNRTSYYNRQTGGKSLGLTQHDLTDDDDEDGDEIDVDGPIYQKSQALSQSDNVVVHSKTYTQRLQDQISKLGQSQANPARSSKSIPGLPPSQVTAAVTSSQAQLQARPLPSPKKTTTPGAFPDDEEDDWIQPLGTPDDASNMFSPRPILPESHSTDIMEGVSGKDSVSGNDFAMPKTRQRTSLSESPQRPQSPDRTTSTPRHQKSASVPALSLMNQDSDDHINLKKTISVSNPPLPTVSENERLATPSKSPSRGYKDSPLKQVKNKLSSILKSSRGLLASSAAISAEGKSSLLSPSTTRLVLNVAPSTETLGSPLGKDPQPLYPDLSRQDPETQALTSTTSPGRTESHKSRASIDKERAEEKRREKEAKEARRMMGQMEKLEKAREKEREKARVFSKEQEKVVAMEKQLSTQKEQEKKAVAATPRSIPKATRSSPRKAKTQRNPDEGTANAAPPDDNATDDVEMVDVPQSSMPPPSAPRSAAPSSATKGREIKRPTRPTKEPVAKTKQAPTVIRVNMGSQHSQYHPSNAALSSSLYDTLSQPQLKSKASQASLQPKPSMQSLKSSTSSSGRPKALEAAARRKEQEEREAQRKREAKAEMERRRAAMQEEERRQEQQRKLEAERQKEEERKQAAAQAEAKKNAQRQAALEKAKQTRAPPPAVRTQPQPPSDHGRVEAPPVRPPSRMNSNIHRSLEESSRPVGTGLQNGPKAPSKRPLQPDHNDENSSRTGPARVVAGFQPKESKRMRMTNELNNDFEVEKQPSLKGAPVRPSGGLKKEIPTKSMFPAGYANAPQNGTRDLFKTMVTSQHSSQIKATHPLDMAQVSKAAIPFASNPNLAGPSHKTPARPQGVAAAKSTAKSANRFSPRFQNGDSIELPEINTDDEDDEYDDGGKVMAAAWADSPVLRKALVEQESKDPFQVFGAPGPLNMEEVFAKSKDRFHKFRARTSSANWSGADRLTEDDIRKDMAARDKMRRDGGWTYEMGRDMI